MTLRTRLATLEKSRPAPAKAPGLKMSDLNLPPDLCDRIKAAYKAGTYPHSLSIDDVMTIIHAAEAARGRK